MMGGLGSYVASGGGEGSYFSSSNLSASAPPFKVDWPARPSVPSASEELFDRSFDSPFNTYKFPSAQPYDPGFAEAGYEVLHSLSFPGYAKTPPALEHPGVQSSMWGGVASQPQQHKPFGFSGGGGVGSEDKNQTAPSPYNKGFVGTETSSAGTHASEGLSKREDSYGNNMCTSRKLYGASVASQQLNDKYSLRKPVDFLPTHNSRSAVVGSTSKCPESYSKKASSQLVDPWSNEVRHDAFLEKLPKHQNFSHDDPAFAKADPGFFMAPPAYDTSFLVSNMCPGKSTHAEAESNLAINTLSTGVPCPWSSSGGNLYPDASRQSIHLGGDGHSLEQNLSAEKELLSNRSAGKDPLDHYFGADSKGFLFDPVNFRMAFGRNEANGCIKNSFESLDHHNTTVDSPCWKGAPAAQSSPFKVSKFTVPQLIDNLQGSSQAPQFFTVGTNDAIKTSKIPSEHLLADYSFQDHVLASSLKGPSASNLLSGVCESSIAKKAAVSNDTKSSFSLATQSPDAVNQPSKPDGVFNKSIDEPDKNPYWNLEQTLGDVSYSEKKGTLGGGVGNALNNVNDVLDCDSSHRPFHAIKDVSSPCSSKEVNPAKLSELHDEILPPRFNVHSLVDAVQNLSDMLLYECSKKVSKLEEEEYKTLKKAISNLHECISKASGPTTQTEQALLPQPVTSQSFPDMVKLVKDASTANSQVANVAASDFLDPFNNHHVKKVEKQHDGHGDAETVKDDKMTQSIKNILAQNFPVEEEMQPQVLLYKDLWLEAEAALCSMTYMARFNRIKNEMEKTKLQIIKGSSTNAMSPSRRESSPDPVTSHKQETILNGGQTLGSPAENSPVMGAGSYDNDVMVRLHILRCRDLGSNSKETQGSAHNPNATEKSELNLTESKISNFLVDNSPIVDAGSYDNDFMARLHILKCRDIGSSSADIAAEEKSEKSMVSPNPNMHAKSELIAISSKVQDISVQGFSDEGANSHWNDALVRFHILNSQVDEQNSIETLDAEKPSSSDVLPPPDEVVGESSAEENRSQISDVPFLETSPDFIATSQPNTLESSVMARFNILRSRAGHSSSKDLEQELALDVLDQTTFHPTKDSSALPSSLRTIMHVNDLSARDNESGSLDWEHVSKEDITGHTC